MNETIAWHEYSTKTSVYTILNLFCNTFWRVIDYTVDTVEHLILTCFFYIILCIILYTAIVKWRVFMFQRDMKHVKRVLIVIAHPDDECMFFGPTILHFTQNKKCRVYLMCLSTGRYRGMGQTRRYELYKSCEVLGINEDSVIVHNHSKLQDAMEVRWSSDLISQLILDEVYRYGINTLITFDRHGVSQHWHHCSIYYGVANLIIDRKLPKNCVVYVLETVNVIRKYWLILDIPLSYILSRYRYIADCSNRAKIHKAMKMHKSQLVWFRQLYMVFSRYMLINTLQEMNLVDVELDLEIDD